MKEFIYTQDTSVDEPIMFIDNEIGTGVTPDDGKPRIDGNEFLKELMLLDTMGKKSICVYINSPGGVVTDGMAIYEAIKRAKTPVNTYCYGIAYSIAGVIFQAGKQRIMADQSSLMYHDPFQEGDGELTEVDKKMLEVLTNGIVTMIVANTGKTEDEVKKMMNKTTFIEAKDAKKLGFCDEVNDKDGKFKNLTSLLTHKNANKILNRVQQVDPPKPKQMEKVCNLLKINKNTTEDGIYDAVKEVMDKKKSDDEKMEKYKSDLTAAEAKCADLQKKIDDLKKNIEDAATAAKAKAEAEMDEKSEGELKNAVDAGKIKNDAETIKHWKNMFKVDFAGTKKVLDDMAATKKGATFVNREQRVSEAAAADPDAIYKAGAAKMNLAPGSAAWYNYIRTEKAKAGKK